ncbi:hypothetical protein [Eudoraea adriatica]|uniref:hypothetical protein n=1 Tax=Eudoraea adriatica TaxID=446681 RepID=UPI00037F9FF1|nr:hypothetical protein [Eudoraea adriatica]
MNTTKNGYFFKKLKFLLILTSFTFATSWLPFIRGIADGESYQWGASLFGNVFYGKGISGDFYYVVLNVIIGLMLMYSFYWIKNRIAFYLLLILWYGSMIANSFFEVFAGEGYMFHGDTLNIHLDLSFIVIPLMIVVGTFVVYVILEDRKYSFVAKGTKKNKFWAMLLLTPIPLQAVLFSMGEPHGLTDKIGVIIALLQVALAWTAFKAYDVMGQ